MDNITIATPVEIDTEIARLSIPLMRAGRYLTHLQSLDFRNRRFGSDEQIEKARQDVEAAELPILPLEAEFTRRDGWARFFLVTNSNGHIHSSQACSTCRWDTQFAWLPMLSGQTEEQAVADQGEILCSVCYPSAPVEWTNGESKRTKEERAARAAEKVERDAKRAAKAITQPDGRVLKDTNGWEIKTERTAWVDLVDDIFTSRFWNYRAHPEWQDIVVASLSHKLGQTEDEIRTLVEAKVKAKAKREGKL